MKGPTLLDLGKFIGKAATFAAKAAGVTQTIAAATGIDTGAAGTTTAQLDDAVHELQTEAIDLQKRLQDMANDEARDEQQLGELQQTVDGLNAAVQKWQAAYLSADQELSLLRFQVSVIGDVVGPQRIQDAISARRASTTSPAAAATVDGTVDGTNWQNMKGPGGATPLDLPAPTWDDPEPSTAGGAS